MNHVELAATLAQDAELKYTPGGLAILELELAGTDLVAGDDGKARELPWYHRVTVFGPFAEKLANEELKAGDAAYVVGRLQYESWENQEGQKRSALKIVGTIVRVLPHPTPDRLDHDTRGQPRLRNSVNRVLLIGNVTKDATIRYTSSGHAFLAYSLAVNEKFKDRRGQDQERTTFVDATAWRELAEANADLSKGAGIVTTGRLVNDSWTDREGNKRFATKLEAHDLREAVKLGAPRTAAAAVPAGRQAAAAPAGGGATLDIDDQDLPF